MERAKLKNIIIVLLLVVNLFLLLLVGGRTWQHRGAEADLRKSTVSFLAKEGIAIAEESIPWETLDCLQITERDAQEERRLAEAILGEVKEVNFGVALDYTGERGTARFSPDGRFLISLQDGAVERVSDPARHATRYLKDFGFTLLQTAVQTEGEETVVSFLQLAAAVPVFTCEIELCYRAGELYRVQGWRLLGELQPDNTQQPLSAATLLLRFAASLDKAKLVCTEIRSITQGYVYSTTSLSAQSNLLPVWRIETDTDTFLLNCMTGQLEAPGLWLHQSASLGFTT